MLKILVPKKQDVFRIAGDEFAAIWKKSARIRILASLTSLMKQNAE